MKEGHIIGISDYFQLAILDLYRIVPVKTERRGRYWVYYKKQDVEPLLTNYESGGLQVVARDFTASIQRVKTRIFENERQSVNSSETGRKL